MTTQTFCAFDLGAESGRAIVGKYANGLLTLTEVHRFPNGPVRLRSHLHWDLVRLAEELKTGLRLACAEGQPPPDCFGIDTWGVDFAFFAQDGSLLGLPFAYRDPQTDGMVEDLSRVIRREDLYRRTGIQFQPFNSIVQLHALHKRKFPFLEWADALLFIPDALTYLLTGIKRTEFTFATTSQMFNASDRRWDVELAAAVGVRRDLLQDIVQPGTLLGLLDPEVAGELKIPQIPAVAVATHDTASAVASVPAEGEGWGYISSGTWSLMGMELRHPVLTSQALDANFTNEGGVDGTYRFLRNIMGLWLLQECRRIWSAERAYSYDELARIALQAPPFRSLVNPDWPGFYRPADMPGAIREFCRLTGQRQPEDHAQTVRCIFESLALKYRETYDAMCAVAGLGVDRLHIIGGGSKNALLCQFTANATRVPVLAGPAEGTAIGNVMMQARALGVVGSLAEMRDVIRRSWAPVRYEAADTPAWEEAYHRFRSLDQPKS
jgi:rhamnulokinase